MALTRGVRTNFSNPAFVYVCALHRGMSVEDASQAYEWAKELEHDEFYDVHNHYNTHNYD